MADPAKDTRQVDNNRPYLEGVAKSLVDRIYGPDGPPWGTKFVELEDLVVELGKVLQQSMMAQALTRQADSFAKLEPAAGDCPSCGRPTGPADPEPRLVHSRGGEAEWQEPQQYCTKCRRAFFPSVQESGH